MSILTKFLKKVVRVVRTVTIMPWKKGAKITFKKDL